MFLILKFIVLINIYKIPGQQTISLFFLAWSPNSNKVIGDFVEGIKFIKIISDISKAFNSHSTYSLNSGLLMDYTQVESHYSLLGLKIVKFLWFFENS